MNTAKKKRELGKRRDSTNTKAKEREKDDVDNSKIVKK